MLSKTPKPTDPQKRPVGRPRKHDPLETTQTPTPPQDEALKPSNKPKTHKKTKGQDDKPTDQENT
ncbi:hypothetical protein NHP21005_20210 (plasmid) [Helicobacter sp. NHP21005]|nr:hypothetical protein [Helicobacter sp. NHP21005]BEG58333.1 hypothetical protein NHP21005_20210 [Helicobacter sp. NHP21005]